MIASSWIQEARRYGVAQVAAELGIEGTGRSLRSCPACGATRRSRGDRRPPVGLYERGQRWRCWACDASGTAIDLVGHALGGAVPSGPEVRAWYSSRGWAPESGVAPRAEPASAPPAPPVEAKPRPDGVMDFWDSCEPVTDHPAVASYLEGRGIDPVAVEDLDLARVQTDRSVRSSWGYSVEGYPLILPMYDASGAMVSVRFRRVTDGSGPKSLAPRGCDASGLVFADAAGLRLLEGGGSAGDVLVLEGGPDLLDVAAAAGGGGPSPALLAVGSWSSEIGAQIADGSDVTVATDADEEGERKASQIASTLEGRCIVRRLIPSVQTADGEERGDVNGTLGGAALIDAYRSGHRAPRMDGRAPQGDSLPYQTTPDGRPYIVVPPGRAAGWFVSSNAGGFGLTPKEILHVELERHWPDLPVEYQPNIEAPPKKMPPAMLFSRYGVRASAVYYTYIGESRFEPRPGHTGDVYVRCLSDEHVPAVRHDDVLEYLRVLCGDQTEILLDWLSTVHRFDRPTGVPVLIGAHSSGKSMLPQGLGRRFAAGTTDYDDIFKERFNDALLRSPIVWLDEVTETDARSGRFRKLTANLEHSIEGKGIPSGLLRGSPRLIVTSNEPDPLRLGRERLSATSEDAIGSRIIQIDCRPEAADWLRERGGYALTAEWVTRSDGRPGKIAETIAWLEKHRSVGEPTRFLVEGDAAAWAARIGSRQGLAGTVLDALAIYLSWDSTEREALPAHPFLFDESYPDHVLVFNKPLRECWSSLLGERAPSHRAVASALEKLGGGAATKKRTLSDGSRPRCNLIPLELVPDPDMDLDG